MSFLYNLNINPLSDIWFANILSYSIGRFVILLFLSFFFCLLVWCDPTFASFSFCGLYFWCHIQKLLPRPMSRHFFFMIYATEIENLFFNFLASSLLVYKMHLIFVFLFHTQKIYWIFLLVICRVLVFSMFMIVSFFLPFLSIYIFR